jgi:hypothetical protein
VTARIPIVFHVNPGVVPAWLAGVWDAQKPDSRAWHRDVIEEDLLNQAVAESPVVYIARINSRSDWNVLRVLYAVLKPEWVLFRTRCAGLVNLVRHAGGTVAAVETSGLHRCALAGQSLAAVTGRMKRIFTVAADVSRRTNPQTHVCGYQN